MSNTDFNTGLDPSLLSAVQGFEGFAPRASWDYKQYSNGYGTKAQYPGEVIDRDTANSRLQDELSKAQRHVDSLGVQMTPGQRNALTSFTYNLGPGWTNGSGLLDAVKSGDWDAARQHLLSYNKAGGSYNSGLADRRAAEAAMMTGTASDGLPIPRPPGNIPPGSGPPNMSMTDGYGPALAQLMQQQNQPQGLAQLPGIGGLFNSNNGNGMSPLERAAIWGMSINNPSALSALGQGNKQQQQHLQMMQWLMGHQQNQQNADRSYNLQLQSKDLAQQDRDIQRNDSARQRQEGLANTMEGVTKVTTDEGEVQVPKWKAEGFQSNPYLPGGKLYQDFGGRQTTPTGPGGSPLPVPPRIPAPQAQAAPVPPAPSAGPAYASVAAPPPQAPAPQPAPPAAPVAQPQAPPQPAPAAPEAQASAAPLGPEEPEPFRLPAAEQVNGQNAQGTTKRYADAVSAYRQANPNATTEDIINGIEKSEPALADYLRSAKDGTIDPTKTYRGKNQQWMQNAQTMISSVLGQDPEYIASRFADNKKFREEDLNVSKPGSISNKMQSVRNMAGQIIDQNQRFNDLGSDLDKREGGPNTLAMAQEGWRMNLPHWLGGGMIQTPSMNSHAYGDSGKAGAFNTYEQTLGTENNKFMVPGANNGTAPEREQYQHAVTDQSKPSTYVEQRARMDSEGRIYANEALQSVEAQFGKNSAQYREFKEKTYDPTIASLDKAKADTEKRFGKYADQKPPPEAAPYQERINGVPAGGAIPGPPLQGRGLPPSPQGILNSIAAGAQPQATLNAASGQALPPGVRDVTPRQPAPGIPWWAGR